MHAPAEPGVMLAAGGTGGHLLPARALAGELAERGRPVLLVTDARGRRFLDPADELETVDVASAPAGGASPLAWARAGLAIARGRRAVRLMIRQRGVGLVAGFGGYPALPAMLAAGAEGLPVVVHEQNAVMGRVNRLLASRVSLVVLGFEGSQRIPEGVETRVVGNPVRAEVLAAAGEPYRPPPQGQPVRLLVVGGSQGARVLADTVPAALAALGPARVRVVQQARPEDLDRVRAAYAQAGITAEVEPFFRDLPRRMAAAHLVVARAGASTLAELAVIGRPAVLVPFAAATDDHQTVNARGFVEGGGGWTLREADATPERLAALVRRVLDTPGGLAAAAEAAKSRGRPDACRVLADLVEERLRQAA